MKKHAIAALCAITIIIPQSNLIAGEEEVSPAIRLLRKMDFEKTAIESASGMFEPMMNHFAQLGLPAEALKEIQGAMEKFMHEILSAPEIMTGVAKIYEDNFTPAEIEELIAFYDSPLGRKVIDAQPAIAQAAAELTMKTTMENQERLQQDITKIMEKYHDLPGDTE